ncbi:DUF6508 domain-containing protein [Methanogenium marinum]|uniref:DUF6508 domain-containing protein n=1 Tax=Methanogenium marinum TaxID=348610 RepID=A0A9Q4KRU0_9EURY|nr:DUF6508 domain-containing protein [Methanogenium marinum]MDE4907517.1 DUF6508 domain-containing protein [Methanogenium marinum]
MHRELETPTPENFEAVLAYRGLLDGAKILKGHEEEIRETGTCPPVNEFVRMLYDNNWLINSRWQGWADETTGYFEKPSLLCVAETETIRRILTVHVRIDRMMPGEVSDIIQKGYMLSVVNRIAEIYEC